MSYQAVRAEDAGIPPICECHGEPQRWDSRPDYRAGGRWLCGVKRRESARRWRETNRDKHREANRKTNGEWYRNGRQGEYYAEQLSRGEQIQAMSHHHLGMGALKGRLGDPRPRGLTLSLVNPDSPSGYWGYDYRNGQRVPYRLSTDPDDYMWETLAENCARKKTTKETP